MNDNLLDDIEVSSVHRRRALLPGWIRFFCWFFIVSFALMAVILAVAVTMFPAYESEIFKGGVPAIVKWILSIVPPLAGILLWMEYRYAVRYAFAAGIATILSSGYDVYDNIRKLSEQQEIVEPIVQLVLSLLSLVICIFFLQKMAEIRAEWEATP
ncbi:hypothetical protein ACWKWU_11475 [Chitinophaga lutea]